MKKQKKNDKGFTLVELVVVIAIIAILGAVSVVGYFAFIEKANKSADEQLCTQYNTLLKAQSVSDDDITLPELVTLIEENGINSNQFNTVSKDYVFAYNRTAKEVILLDKNSGTPAFPTKHEALPTDLWSTLRPDFKMQAGVANYALFQSVTYKAFSGTLLDEYTFDLNNHVIKFDNVPTKKVNLTNGMVVKTSTDVKDSQLIAQDEKTEVIDNQEKVVIGTGEEVKTKFNTALSGAESKTMSGIYAASNEKYQYDIPTGTAKKLLIENCVFDNIRLELPSDADLDVEIRNCKFFNYEGYAYHGGQVKNLYMHDNVVDGCNRSFSINVATEITRIENNTFNLDAIKTSNKDERKDNALQFTLDNKKTTLFNDWANSPVLANPSFKVIIDGNKVEKALAFVTLHDGWCNEVTKEAQKTAVKNLLVAEHFEFGTNVLKANVSKFARDPGVDKDRTPDQKTFYDTELVPSITALIK